MTKAKYSITILFLFSLASCYHMNTIIAEMDQVSEKCAIIEDPDVYHQFNVDPKKETIIYYSLFLDLPKRHYLSACGTHISKNFSRHLHSKAIEDGNPVSRETYMTINNNLSSLDYYFICIVGGFSAAGDDMSGFARKMNFSKKDGDMTCDISIDRNTKPQFLGPRDRDGRLNIEKE